MKKNRFIFAMITLLVFILIVLFLVLAARRLSAQTPSATLTPTATLTQQCQIPRYAAIPLGSLMTWAYQGLEAEPDNFNDATDWLAHSPDSARAGPYMGNVLLRAIELANGVEPSEWEAIGVSVGCAPGGIYQEYCD